MKKIIKSRDEEERKKLASEKKTEEGRKQERNEKRKKEKRAGFSRQQKICKSTSAGACTHTLACSFGCQLSHHRPLAAL